MTPACPLCHCTKDSLLCGLIRTLLLDVYICPIWILCWAQLGHLVWGEYHMWYKAPSSKAAASPRSHFSSFMFTSQTFKKRICDLYFAVHRPLSAADPVLHFPFLKKLPVSDPLPHFRLKEDRRANSSAKLSGKPSVHYISQNLHWD